MRERQSHHHFRFRSHYHSHCHSRLTLLSFCPLLQVLGKARMCLEPTHQLYLHDQSRECKKKEPVAFKNVLNQRFLFLPIASHPFLVPHSFPFSLPFLAYVREFDPSRFHFFVRLLSLGCGSVCAPLWSRLSRRPGFASDGEFWQKHWGRGQRDTNAKTK